MSTRRISACWAIDIKGQSHKVMFYVTADGSRRTKTHCDVPDEQIAAVRFTDSPANPCPICQKNSSFPKPESVLVHEDRK